MTLFDHVDLDPQTIPLHESAQRVDGIVETAAACWAYAAVIPLPERTPTESGDSHAVITIDVEIIDGRVGFGVLTSDGTAFLVEHVLDAGSRRMSVRAALPEAGPIVFRNTSLMGQSRFRINRLCVAFQQGGMTYPVHVSPRDVKSETVPIGGDSIVFNDDSAAAINRARMDFVRGLGLPLNGARVLDVGAGVGHFANLYESLGAEVTAIEGRPTNLDEMRSRYPRIHSHLGDIQSMDVSALGTFDVVHCFGLLYHLDSPVAALRRMESLCRGVLLLETIVADAAQPVMVLADETFAVNQALAGLGCRPSPSFITLALSRVGFRYVYAAASPPEHADFRFEWRNTFETSRDGHNLRCIFVASRTAREDPALVPLLDPGWD